MNEKKLYFGHFSFTQRKSDGDYNGYFTTIAQAGDVEEASGKFKTLITKIHKGSSDVFKNGEIEICLDSCIEIVSLPAGGVFGYYAASIGKEPPPRICTALIDAPEESANSYSLEPDQGDDEGPVEVEPFVVLSNESETAVKQRKNENTVRTRRRRQKKNLKINGPDGGIW